MNLFNPRQVILVSTRILEEKDNVITLSWHMPISFNPLLYAIAVGNERYSNEIIRESKCFCVNFIGKDLEEYAISCGKISGKYFNKISVETEECNTIECIRLKDSIGYLECEVINQITKGDHTIYIGKVLKSNINNDKPRMMQKEGSEFTYI